MRDRQEYGFVFLCMALIAACFLTIPPARSTVRTVDLDGDPSNGNEGTLSLSVVTPSPAKIKNKVTNKSVGEAFRFSWPLAGPGGFLSEAGTPDSPGTAAGVGAIWVWQSTLKFALVTDSIDLIRTFPDQAPRPLTFPVAGVVESAGSTVTDQTLSASLFSFFSPPRELVRITSNVEQLPSGLFRYTSRVANLTAEPVVFDWAPAPLGCTPALNTRTDAGSLSQTHALRRRHDGVDGPDGQGLHHAMLAPAACKGTSSLTYPGAPNFRAVGDLARVRIGLGAARTGAGKTLSVQRVRFDLDCTDSAPVGLACLDAGALVSYQGNIRSDCAAAVWSASHAAGEAFPNEIVFTPDRPIAIPRGTSEFCHFEFDVKIEAPGAGRALSRIVQVSGFNASQGDLVCDSSPQLTAGATSAGALALCGNCDDHEDCTDDTCDPMLGCEHVNNHSACDDHDACTDEDACSGGACAGKSADCDDNNPCTDDGCDGHDGCTHEAHSGGCEDGNLCTTGDSCHQGHCASGGPANCSDGSACTVDSCDPLTGCAHVPIPGCKECTKDADCNDFLVCTVDDCDSGHTCEHEPDSSRCADGLFCNGAEVCDPQNGCLPGAAPCSGDSVSCTVDSCDEARAACRHDPDDHACDDGLFCDGVEKCDPIRGCRPRTPVACDDHAACTADTCDEARAACGHAPIPGCCTTEVCSGGVDEDCDHLVDCRDPDCAGSPECAVACSFPGLRGTIPPFGVAERVVCSEHPGTEVSDRIVVCGDSILSGPAACGGQQAGGSQGTANVLVPDEAVEVEDVTLAPSNVDVEDAGGNHLIEPGESVDLFISLINAGPVALEEVSATLATPPVDLDGDGTLDPALVFTRNSAAYSRCAAGPTPASPTGDCDSGPAFVHAPCTNQTPFALVFPAGHPIDTSHPFVLSVHGVLAGSGAPFPADLPVSLGVSGPFCGDGLLSAGEACDDGNDRDGDCCSSSCTFDSSGAACTVDTPLACRAYACNGAGACLASVRNDGPCDDGNVCTQGDTCLNGACTGAPKTCDDNNPCSDDACNPQAGGDGCVHTNNTNPCSVTPAPGGSDQCPGGTCSGGQCVPVSSACPAGIVEADTTVREARPQSNYGRSLELEADNPPGENQAFVRFRVEHTGAQRITRAVLRLFALKSAGSGGRIHVLPCSWNETTVTWDTRPALGAVLDTKGPIVAGQPYDFDVTGVLGAGGDGVYCVGLDNLSADADYNSREAPALRPEVVIETACPCAPAAAGPVAGASGVPRAPGGTHRSLRRRVEPKRPR